VHMRSCLSETTEELLHSSRSKLKSVSMASSSLQIRSVKGGPTQWICIVLSWLDGWCFAALRRLLRARGKALKVGRD
jgi:hypothetical protein